MRNHLHAALPCLLVFATVACAATVPAVRMRVVDDGDESPIAGVVALFWGAAHEGTISGHGGRQAILFAADAESDAAGELRFAVQDFRSQPFFLNTNYENPMMVLLKPGYAPLVLVNRSHIIPTLAEASTWEYDGQAVRMKKATDAEIQRQAYLVKTYTDTAAGFEPPCGWKKVARALVVADRIFPPPGNTNTLRTLLMNEAVFVEKGCGSPTAFFAPFLR
jgi:hypothetical protein